MARPRLLDLFCGAGGASVGYERAGFDVTGVDLEPQPRYPFAFVQADALGFLTGYVLGAREAGLFSAVHASPPCQAYSKAQRIRGRDHPDLIDETRRLLEATRLPWVIENVPGAPLRNPVVLEGQMFDGLRTQRTRWFEANWPLDEGIPFLRGPRPAPLARMGRPPKPGEWVHAVGNMADVAGAREAMGIDWMSRDELREAIPPAFTEEIGRLLMIELAVRAVGGR